MFGEREHGKHRGQSHAVLEAALQQKEHVVLRAVVAIHMVDDRLARQTRTLHLVDILRHASAPYYHSLCFLTCVTEEPPR